MVSRVLGHLSVPVLGVLLFGEAGSGRGQAGGAGAGRPAVAEAGTTGSRAIRRVPAEQATSATVGVEASAPCARRPAVSAESGDGTRLPMPRPAAKVVVGTPATTVLPQAVVAVTTEPKTVGGAPLPDPVAELPGATGLSDLGIAPLEVSEPAAGALGAERGMESGRRRTSATLARRTGPGAAGDTRATSSTVAASRKRKPRGSEPSLRPADFLRRVEACYPKLLGEDAERRQAAFRRLEANGAFDLLLRGGRSFEEYNKEGKTADFTSDFAGFELPLRTGDTLFGGYTRNEGLVKSPASTTGGGGFYNIGLRIPLLKGRWINPRIAAERQAELGVPRADSEFASARLEILLGAAVQYWNWVAAGKRHEIAGQLLEVSRTRAEQIAAEVREGSRQGLDELEAQAEVARREEAVAKTERDFQKEMFKLSLYLWTQGEVPVIYPGMERVPEDALGKPSRLSAEAVNRARTCALAKRPELRALELSMAQTGIDLDLAENDLLPALDLTINPGTDRGNNAVGSQLKYGVAFSVPLQQRAAQGKIGQAQLKREKLVQEFRLTRRTIVTDVDDAASAVNLTVKRYEAASREAAVARELEAGERERLALGEGTLFLVNQRERATAEAEVKLVNIQAEYEQSLATFRALSCLD